MSQLAQICSGQKHVAVERAFGEGHLTLNHSNPLFLSIRALVLGHRARIDRNNGQTKMKFKLLFFNGKFRLQHVLDHYTISQNLISKSHLKISVGVILGS